MLLTCPSPTCQPWRALGFGVRTEIDSTAPGDVAENNRQSVGVWSDTALWIRGAIVA